MENINNTNITFNCLARSNLSHSNVTDPEFWKVSASLGEAGSAIIATIYVLLFVVATIWNLFIVTTYIFKFKLLKEPGNLFLFNLALPDLLVALTVMMFSFVAQGAREFVFGSTDVVRCHMCNFAGFCLMFFIFVSLHMLAALSIDRFILLSYPLRYKQMLNWRKALCIIVSIWVISFFIALLPIIGFGQYEFNIRYGACLPRFSEVNIVSNVNNFFYVVAAVVEALIPISILALTNVFTYRLVSKFLKRNFTRRQTFRNRSEVGKTDQDSKKYHGQQKQLVRVFGALLVANMIAWTPVIAVVFGITISGQAEKVPDGVYIFGWLCYLTTPAIHPIVESFFVKDLRYQVTRARKTVRRASTYFVKSLTRSKFDDSDLNAAEAAVDAGKPGPKREIKFFKPTQKNGHNITDSTVVMDVDDMSSTRMTPTPPPDTPKESSNGRRSVTFVHKTTTNLEISHTTSATSFPLKSTLKSPSLVTIPNNATTDQSHDVEPSTDQSHDVERGTKVEGTNL